MWVIPLSPNRHEPGHESSGILGTCENSGIVELGGVLFKVTVEEGNWKEIPSEFVPVDENTRWECTRCGWCCTRDWQIELSWKEYDRLKDVIPIDRVIHDRSTGDYYPYLDVGGKCPVFDGDTRRCTIYNSRPYICRAFPFYLHPPGELYVSTLCRGLGRGPSVRVGRKMEELVLLRADSGMDVSLYSV